MKSFEFVPTVPERSHSVDVEGVLSLADGGDSLLQPGEMNLLVGPATVVCDRSRAHGHCEASAPLQRVTNTFKRASGRSTCQTFLLVFGLLLSVEGVEGPRGAIGEEWREFLRLQLLLNAMELTSAGWH